MGLMVFSSSDISGMVGQYHQQLNLMSARNGFPTGAVLPPIGSPGMQGTMGSFANPYYGGHDFGPFGSPVMSPGGAGAATVGAMGGALPAMANTLAFAPFMGAANRMFQAGAGFGGQGFMGAARGIGGLGLRGGMGALGGGLAAAALPLAGMAAAGAAFDYVGSNIYQGAQNISQVGAMANQYFAPGFGGGARPGGMQSRETIKQVTSILHEIAGQDTMASFQDLKRVMDQAGQMGMLTGINNPAEFKQKFKAMVGKVRDLAQVMGTSLEEAAPLFGQMRQMGLWRADDVMGTAGAMRMVGATAAPHLMGAMGSGARGSWQMGGSLQAGAMMGQSSFLNVNEAVRSGVLTDEAIIQLTGGTGGVEGQRMVADRMTQIMQNTSQMPIGRLAMAGLGRVENGRFTGEVDAERLQQFISGNLSLDDLQGYGMGNTRGRRGAASFVANQDLLSQNVMAGGGMELMTAMAQKTLEKAGYGGAGQDIQQLMIEKLMHVGSRDAQMLQRMMSRLPEIMDKRTERAKAALDDAFRSADERQNRSLSGLGDALSQAFEDSFARPIQEAAEGLTTSLNESYDQLTDAVMGRQRRMSVGRGERMRLLSRSDLPSLSDFAPGGFSRAEGMVNPGGIIPSYAEGLRRRGLGGTLGNLFGTDISGRGRLMQSLGVNVSRRSGGLFGLGRDLRDGEQIVGDRNWAGDIPVAADSDIERAAQLALRRTGRGFSREDAFAGAGGAEALGQFTEEYRRLLVDPTSGRRIEQQTRGMSETEKARYILGQMMGRPGGMDALTRLQDARTNRGANRQQVGLDALVLAARDVPSAIGVNAEGMARDLGHQVLPRDAEGRQRFMQGNVDQAMHALTGGFSRAAPGAASGLMGRDTAGLYGRSSLPGFDMTKSALAGVLEGDSALDLLDYFNTGSMSPSLEKAMLQGGSNPVVQVARQYDSLDAAGKERLRKAFVGTVALKQDMIRGEEHRARIGEIAGKDLGRLGKAKGLRSSTRRRLEEILGGFGSGKEEDYAASMEGLRALAGSGSLQSSEIDALRRSGAAFGGQLAAMASLGDLGGVGMTEEGFRRDVQKKLGSVGFDVLGTLQKARPDDYREIMRSFDDGKLDRSELQNIRQIVKGSGVLNPEMVTEQRQQQAENMNKLVGQLTNYTQANEKFVRTVDVVLPGLAQASNDIFRRGAELMKSSTEMKDGY